VEGTQRHPLSGAKLVGVLIILGRLTPFGISALEEAYRMSDRIDGGDSDHDQAASRRGGIGE